MRSQLQICPEEEKKTSASPALLTTFRRRNFLIVPALKEEISIPRIGASVENKGKEGARRPAQWGKEALHDFL